MSAAVIVPPLAIQAARRKRLDASRLVVATALTTNATSFLLPTSNVTNLLVLDQSHISAIEYLSQGWAAWLLVSVLTVDVLSLLIRRSTAFPVASDPVSRAVRPIVPTMVDLLPMFVIASAIRALLGGGVAIPGGFTEQFLAGSLLAAAANNLPAAAAIGTAVHAVPWPAIWSMAMGPNLLLTGSVATIICRRTARDLGVRFESRTFTLWGAAMLLPQFLAAGAGLALALARL